MQLQISAILSDYDGTLCPTSSIRSRENVIPEKLENILWDISDKVPICIISSKDFGFLHNKTKFASVISCILGIETLVLKKYKKKLSSKDSREEMSNGKVVKCHDYRYIENSYLSVDNITLQYNSELLSQIAEEIASSFRNVSIEHKFASPPNKTLAGITIDWRHRDD
jgi:hypothetical protein